MAPGLPFSGLVDVGEGHVATRQDKILGLRHPIDRQQEGLRCGIARQRYEFVYEFASIKMKITVKNDVMIHKKYIILSK